MRNLRAGGPGRADGQSPAPTAPDAAPDGDEIAPAAAGDGPLVPGGATPRDGVAMRRTHVRGSTLLLLGRGLTLLITTATQVVIVRALTKTEFGGFAYALALAGAGQTLLSLGQGRLLSRFMAKYEEQRDYGRMFGSMLLAVATISVTSTIAIAAMFLAHDALIGSAVRDPATTRVVLILVFLGPLEALDQVFVSLFVVFSRPKAIFFRKYLLTPLLRLVIVVVLSLTGASVTYLAIGYLAAGVFGLFVYLAVSIRMLRERGLLEHMHPRRITVPYRSVFS